MVPTLKEGVLELPDLDQFMVLTHEDAQAEWVHRGIQVIPTYRVQTEYPENVKSELSRATHVFWSSGSQFDELKGWINGSAHHASGPGKTAVRLREGGITPTVFPTVQEWRKWLKI